MLTEYFVQLGFSDKEADIYQTLLQIGPSLASTLARLTKIKRTSIYEVLNKLQNRNLIYNFKQGKYTYFAIDDFKKILLEEKEKLKTAELLMEQLKNQQHARPEVQIYYYRGIEGYRELYADILKAHPKELWGWVNLEDFYKSLDPKREGEWTKERIRKKIPAKLIMEKTPKAQDFQKKDSKSLRETRLASKITTTCFLYGDFTTFFDSSTDNSTGIRIHNPAITDLQKNIFLDHWKSLARKN